MYISNATCKRKARKQIKENFKETMGTMIFIIGMIFFSAIATYPIMPKNINFDKDPIPVYYSVIVLLIIFGIWIPLLNGANKYCINMSRNKARIKSLFIPLVKKYFKNTLVIGMFFFVTLLGTVYFVIPGLIFFIIYNLVPCILIDNEDVKVVEAFRKSRKYVIKSIGRFIWLYMTFIPLIITIPITFFISGVVVIPYIFTSIANVYRTLEGEDLDYKLEMYKVEDVEKVEKAEVKTNKKRSKSKKKR